MAGCIVDIQMMVDHFQRKLVARPLSINRIKYGLCVRDVFFAAKIDQFETRGADLVYSVQCRERVPGCTEFYTFIVDLQQASGVLYQGISKTFRYEIRRAEKDGLHVDFIDAPTLAQIERFADYFDNFAVAKRIVGANRIKLLAMTRTNGLHLAWVYSNDPKLPLAVHAYIVDGERARLYYSGSSASQYEFAPQRQLAGRANKALHWYCMQQYQRWDYQRYDLGGVSHTAALKTIDDFKKGFGGHEVVEYNFVRGVSLKGRLVVSIYLISRYVKNSLRNFL